jgi:tRNA(fMet)-specific endonuclease VapC
VTQYLLDTNIISDLVRNPRGRIEQNIQRVGSSNILTNVAVTGELFFGVAKSKSSRLSTQLSIILQGIQVLSLDPPVDQAYGDLRAALEVSGDLIGANDLWIAAQARMMGLTLVTDNVREFSRVPGLTVENWLR